MTETFIHKSLAAGRWQTLSLPEQLGNVGSEVERAISWREKKDEVAANRALERMLELIDLTIADPRWRSHSSHRLKELCRLREVLCDLFYGENDYHTSYDSIRKYFLEFALFARKDR